MDKRASNTFVAGLNTDRHPLTSQPTELIEAQNTELMQVGEGYQLVLQKREGNAELLIVPPAYSSIVTYSKDEYVLSGGVAYISIQNSNIGHTPVSSPAWWTAQTSTSVPAGLASGFIPLAVKEFNNVAYIVSVNPTTLQGELGTFPSPDYSQFVYTEGAVIPNGAIVGAGVYDPTADTPEYGFTITPSAGIYEYINGEDENVSLVSSFVITNTGANQDSYSIVCTGGAALDIFVSVNGGPVVAYNPAAKPTITTLQTIAVTFKVPDAFIFSPEEPVFNIIEVTAVDGPASSATTFNCTFETSAVLQVREDGTTTWFNGLAIIVPSFNASYVVNWRTNAATSTVTVTESPQEVWALATSDANNIYVDFWNNDTFQPRFVTFELEVTDGVVTETTLLDYQQQG